MEKRKWKKKEKENNGNGENLINEINYPLQKVYSKNFPSSEEEHQRGKLIIESEKNFREPRCGGVGVKNINCL